MFLNLNFKKKSEWFNNYKNIIKQINKSLKHPYASNWINELSNYTLIPKEEINFYIKKKIFFSYDYGKNKFSYKLSIFFVPIFFFYSIYYIFKIFFLKKNTKDKIFYSPLLIENINSQEELNRYKRLIKYYKNKKVLVRSLSPKPLKLENCLIINQKRHKDYFLKRSDLFFLIKMLIKNIIYSLKFKINFYYFFLVLVDDFYYFENFFKTFKSDFMLSHQHYKTNNIKNFIFNKYGGKSCIIQKNINAHNETGFFYHADILFSFGKKISVKKTFNSNIKRKIPLGSFFMEYYMYSKKKKLGIPKFDVVCFGGNEIYPGGSFGKTPKHKEDYIDHLNWLIKLANDYPLLKIGFKHHANNKNNFELDFLKNSKVKIINQKFNSYFVGNKSKVICSFQSTMVIEFVSLKKIAFFIDPGRRNNQFLGDIGTNPKIRLTNYNKFKNTINEIFYKKNYKKVNDKDYCLKSSNYSKKLFAIFN